MKTLLTNQKLQFFASVLLLCLLGNRYLSVEAVFEHKFLLFPSVEESINCSKQAEENKTDLN